MLGAGFWLKGAAHLLVGQSSCQQQVCSPSSLGGEGQRMLVAKMPAAGALVSSSVCKSLFPTTVSLLSLN